MKMWTVMYTRKTRICEFHLRKKKLYLPIFSAFFALQICYQKKYKISAVYLELAVEQNSTVFTSYLFIISFTF